MRFKATIFYEVEDYDPETYAGITFQEIRLEARTLKELIISLFLSGINFFTYTLNKNASLTEVNQDISEAAEQMSTIHIAKGQKLSNGRQN